MRLALSLAISTLFGSAYAQSNPIRCAGNDSLRMQNETISLDRAAVKASGNCRLELHNMTINSIDAPAIKASGNAIVTMTGGLVKGDPAIDASGNAKVYLQDTETDGALYRIGKAYIGPHPGETDAPRASLGSRRPSASDSIVFDGISLDISVVGKTIRLSGDFDLKTKPPTPAFNLEEVINDLDAKRIGTDWSVTLADTILFDFDRADIQTSSAQTLAKLAYLVREKAGSEVLIIGHTDSKGTSDYNQALSERRALAVVVWLHRNGGIPLDRLAGKGAGEDDPVASNLNPDGTDNPVGRALNRRVKVSFAE